MSGPFGYTVPRGRCLLNGDIRIMNWEIIGATGDWAGAFMVVITLFYLARQIRLNSKQLDRQINSDIGTRMFQSYDPIYQGRNAEIMTCGLRGEAEMSEADRYIFNLLMYRQNGAMIELCDSIRSGDIPDEAIDSYSAHYQEVLLDHPGARKWFLSHWEQTQSTLDLLRLSVE